MVDSICIPRTALYQKQFENTFDSKMLDEVSLQGVVEVLFAVHKLHQKGGE